MHAANVLRYRELNFSTLCPALKVPLLLVGLRRVVIGETMGRLHQVEHIVS